MTFDEAKEITAACVRTAMARTLGEDYVPLPDAPLEQLLEANRLVERAGDEPLPDGGRRLYVTVDPRLLAAHYAFEAYDRDPHALLEALGFEVAR